MATDNPDDLFRSYVERRPRCNAVQVSHNNLWGVAAWLQRNGMGVDVQSGEHAMLRIKRRGEQADLIVNVNDADALVGDFYTNFVVVPGREFRERWEREA